MKIILIAATGIVITAITMHPGLSATTVCNAGVCQPNGTYNTLDFAQNCKTKIATCYGTNRVYSCLECPDGYDRIKQSTGPLVNCANTEYFYTCQENCTGCTNCVSDTTWSAAGVGYQSKTTRTCVCNTCIETVSYQCAPGYYGTPTTNTNGCTRCPSQDNAVGTTVAGSKAITTCNIPANTQLSEITGSYTFTSDCYYTN